MRLGARAAGALAVLAALLAGGCSAPPQYRNHAVPALLVPDAPLGVSPAKPLRLAEGDFRLLPGGIRLVNADRAVFLPSLSLRDETGTQHTNESLLGRVVWIDLWAEWCGTCRAEFSTVQKFHDRFESDGLTILAVCRDSKREKFLAAIDSKWRTFRVVDASGRRFPVPYGAYPTSVFLDRAGRVRAYWQGHRRPEDVENLVRELLAEPPPAEAAVFLPAPELPGPRASDSVVSGRLELPRDQHVAGDMFEGWIELDIDPGWHVVASGEEWTIPLDVDLTADEGVVSVEWLAPRAKPLAGGHGVQQVHTGRVKIPVWGFVSNAEDLFPVQEIRARVTVQACDDASCLVPAELLLSRDLWIAD